MSLVKILPENENQYLQILNTFNFAINYKNVNLLVHFLTVSGKIISNNKINLKVKYYKKIVNAIKKARYFKLLPFTIEVEE